MLILAIHQTPSLTQEKYEQVVRRLTGKTRIESPADLPFEGLLSTPLEKGRTGSVSSTSSNPRKPLNVSGMRLGRSQKKSASKSPRTSSRHIQRRLFRSTATYSSAVFPDRTRSSFRSRTTRPARPLTMRPSRGEYGSGPTLESRNHTVRRAELMTASTRHARLDTPQRRPRISAAVQGGRRCT